MTLVKFNPEKKNNVLLPGFNDIFDSVISDTFFSDRKISNVPAVNISEMTDAYCIDLAAPGLKKEHFKINLEKDILTISCANEQETTSDERSYNRKEFSYHAFTRAFTLPESADADRIEATYADGILSIKLPKKEEAKIVSKQIEIQ